MLRDISKKALSPLLKRKTKIIATIGPATKEPGMIKRLVLAGANVFRLNLSHGGWEGQIERARIIREIEEELGIPIAILIDTRGPEVRIQLNEDIVMKRGQVIEEDKDFLLRHRPLDVRVKQKVVYGDGEASFSVVSTKPLRLKALNPIMIKSGKSLYFQGSKSFIENPPVEDLKDIKKAVKFGVDFIAVSFADSKEVINKVKEVAKQTKVIAKIESKKAIDCLHEILACSDGVMVARGDLGIDMDIELVPAMQKFILAEASRIGKPAVVATQMLESMINCPRPTRAEVTDIASAVWQGASALMLSAETAIGKYPVKAVEMMHKTIMKAEEVETNGINPKESNSIPDAIGKAVDVISLSLNPDVIVCLTKTGFTAQLISKERPKHPVFAFCENKKVLRKLSLFYGIVPLVYSEGKSPNERIKNAINGLKKAGFIKKGSIALFAYAVGSKRTNTIRLVEI